jgi:hypothetical protein
MRITSSLFNSNSIGDLKSSPKRKVVPFELIYPLAKSGNFCRTGSATFGIFKFELVEILERGIF